MLTHPRCMNCHPAGEHPLQGADHHEHRPMVWRNDTGQFRHALRRMPHPAERHLARGRELQEHSRPSALGHRAAVDGLARQDRSAISAASSKTPRATAAAISRCCRSTSPRTISSPGAGPPAPAANLRPARRRPRGNWCRPGSIRARSARGKNATVVPAKAGTHNHRARDYTPSLQRLRFKLNDGVYGSPPEPVIGPAIAGPIGGDDKRFTT